VSNIKTAVSEISWKILRALIIYQLRAILTSSKWSNRLTSVATVSKCCEWRIKVGNELQPDLRNKVTAAAGIRG